MLLDTHLGGLEESKKNPPKRISWYITTINGILINKLIQIS